MRWNVMHTFLKMIRRQTRDGLKIHNTQTFEQNAWQ
jgi:hypothetical protein